MKAPPDKKCYRHTVTTGRGIFAKTEPSPIDLKYFEVTNKDESLERGFMCPRCKAVYTK